MHIGRQAATSGETKENNMTTKFENKVISLLEGYIAEPNGLCIDELLDALNSGNRISAKILDRIAHDIDIPRINDRIRIKIYACIFRHRCVSRKTVKFMYKKYEDELINKYSTSLASCKMVTTRMLRRLAFNVLFGHDIPDNIRAKTYDALINNGNTHISDILVMIKSGKLTREDQYWKILENLRSCKPTRRQYWKCEGGARWWDPYWVYLAFANSKYVSPEMLVNIYRNDYQGYGNDKNLVNEISDGIANNEIMIEAAEKDDKYMQIWKEVACEIITKNKLGYVNFLVTKVGDGVKYPKVKAKLNMMITYS